MVEKELLVYLYIDRLRVRRNVAGLANLLSCWNVSIGMGQVKWGARIAELTNVDRLKVSKFNLGIWMGLDGEILFAHATLQSSAHS